MGSITIHKYYVYIAIMYFLSKPLFTDVWKAHTFMHSKGIVEGAYLDKYTPGYPQHYSNGEHPVIRFTAGDTTCSFLATTELAGVVKLGDSVPVLYNPVNMGEAYVYSFSGFWIRHTGYLIPFGFAITLFFFVDVIPRKWVIRLPHI